MRPRYAFRGLHIDLARQWFEPEVVDRLIDTAAWRKLSHVHLHLTDDEAWRVPVDALPELAAVGGTRGHGLARPADARRRRRSCRARRTPPKRSHAGSHVPTNWRSCSCQRSTCRRTSTPRSPPCRGCAIRTTRPARSACSSTSTTCWCPAIPRRWRSSTAVVDAVAALFPSSPFIHIGGDEVPHAAWRSSPIVDAAQTLAGSGDPSPDVEAAFHRDLVRTIRERTGRRVGAWQEAAESAGVAPDDGYVVGWRTVEVCRELAAAGYDVVVVTGAGVLPRHGRRRRMVDARGLVGRQHVARAGVRFRPGGGLVRSGAVPSARGPGMPLDGARARGGSLASSCSRASMRSPSGPGPAGSKVAWQSLARRAGVTNRWR